MNRNTGEGWILRPPDGLKKAQTEKVNSTFFSFLRTKSSSGQEMQHIQKEREWRKIEKDQLSVGMLREFTFFDILMKLQRW